MAVFRCLFYLDAEEGESTTAAPVPGSSSSPETSGPAVETPAPAVETPGPAMQSSSTNSAPASAPHANPVVPQEELEPGLSMPLLEADLQS